MPRRPVPSRSKRPAAAPGARLAVIFGDQLDLDAPLLQRLDPDRDLILMMEVAEESRHVASHIQRTVLFLSAMRHFADTLSARGFQVRYVTLDDPDNSHHFTTEVERVISEVSPNEVLCTWPGEWRIVREVESWSERLGRPVTILPDDHFITSIEAFSAWAKGRRSLMMEFFYRDQRRRTGYLMRGKPPQPEGGTWNFDSENRRSFGAGGPSPPPPHPPAFARDRITREVVATVRRVLPDLPGRLDEGDTFRWPVTRAQALEALEDFIAHRLANFGPYEDAMWTATPFVYHSVLSPALNLKLLNPRECCEAAIRAYERGDAPLQSVEAFVRQLIGWREFVRGIYWLEGPEYAQRNGLGAHGRLPDFYWSGETDMACMRECLSQVIEGAYGHHIQRLMVTGNFALLSGVHPKAVSDWYLGMFADGIDWVTLPNTLGMVMHADRRQDAAAGVTGLVGTKPYSASGKYIERMSNYCDHCRYDPAHRTGPTACPFTVLYWDFLIRHRDQLSANPRMRMMFRSVDAMSTKTKAQLTIDARALRQRLGVEST
ncbi:MAG: cryptochrome/photolyase family protein [Phycisphaeraceae bacterium]|nr:cryptochrome/photolyase family protein [Phycisphaeraceae bacterium]